MRRTGKGSLSPNVWKSTPPRLVAEDLSDWVAAEVEPLKDRSIPWLSQHHFFRDPPRATYSDTSFFFSPADGVILYQETVDPGEAIVDIKGRPYSLRDAMRDETYSERSLVIGIFMTFFDVHINRIPYPGRLSYRQLDPIDTFNQPMLDVEKGLLEDLRVLPGEARYLHNNQRMINRIDSPQLGHTYYVLQIADYDVDSILPFELKQNQPCDQGHRFSQIRYGSQVDLVIPECRCHRFKPVQTTGWHVQAGIDPLVAVEEL